MDRQHHWNTVYTEKTDREVSWFETLPEISLKMLDGAGLNEESWPHEHHTPWGATQAFRYSRFVREA